MLQRIQTLYLLAVTALMTILCFTPLATYAADGVEGAFVAFDFWWLGVLFALGAVVAFVVIWLFKKRLVQVRLLCAELVLLVGAQIFSLWYAIGFTNNVKAMGEIAMTSIKTSVFFPIVCVILVVLAIRAILKDERLVRSLDRIR
ncbi:MAG: DUF4293 domain-containing protein [Tidjanibacter sp.]|nr:DUF4293 domain-containing protein [Tidjanibacter sp.]